MCYLIAKKYNGHGCIALKAEYGTELAELVDDLSRKVERKGIQILTVSSKEAFGEYAPYCEMDSLEEFLCKLLSI